MQETASAREETHSDLNFRSTRGLPSLRRDIRISRHSFRKHCSYVVKDPISLKYYRWGEREYFISRLLDGSNNIETILLRLQKEFPAQRLDNKTVETCINQFLLSGLLETDAATAHRIHVSTRKRMDEAEKKGRLLSILSKFVSFKITLLDPDLLLLRMSQRLWFLWTWSAVAVLVLMMSFSGWLLLSDSSAWTSRMPDLLGWDNLFMLWVVMILVKVVHEFGHGLSCKHFGGEVHEMGAMFILFSPFLFCNATDSWTFRNKRERLIVTFGGIYLELFLASIAAALWVLTSPGTFNHICFNVMTVCSVMTIFFNANPLMRFDGYYALSDIVEIPNLKQRGDQALITRVAGFFTGGVGVKRDQLVDSFKVPVLIYAFASYLWTFTVAFRMLSAIGNMLQPYGLDRIFQTASGITLIAGIVAPPIMVGYHIRNLLKLNREVPGFSKTVYTRLLIGAALLFLILCIPVPLTVRSSCFVEGSNKVHISSTASGYLREILVHDGDHVLEGAPLARLENPEIKAQLTDLQLHLREIQAHVDACILQQADAQIPSLRADEAQVKIALKKALLDEKGLTITAPVSGTVILSRDLERVAGMLLHRGELFCEILPTGPMQAVAAVSEADAGLVKSGQHVRFRLESHGESTFTGTVADVSEQLLSELPHQSLSQSAGGTVPSVMTASKESPTTPHAIPSDPIYRVRVSIDNSTHLLRVGMSGLVRIDCGRISLGHSLWNQLSSLIREDLKL